MSLYNNIQIKSMAHKSKTTVIVMDRNDGLHRHQCGEIEQNNALEALAVLIGGYNEFGRKMNLEKWEVLEQKFGNILDEVNRLIHD